MSFEKYTMKSEEFDALEKKDESAEDMEQRIDAEIKEGLK